MKKRTALLIDEQAFAERGSNDAICALENNTPTEHDDRWGWMGWMARPGEIHFTNSRVTIRRRRGRNLTSCPLHHHMPPDAEAQEGGEGAADNELLQPNKMETVLLLVAHLFSCPDMWALSKVIDAVAYRGVTMHRFIPWVPRQGLLQAIANSDPRVGFPVTQLRLGMTQTEMDNLLEQEPDKEVGETDDFVQQALETCQPSVRTVKVASYINQELHFPLGGTLRSLIFEEDLTPSQHRAPITLPQEGLEVLKLPFFYDHPVKLPMSLRECHFSDMFNQPLTLPPGNSLQSLSFGYAFNQALDDLPSCHCLRSLSFGHAFNKSIALPRGLLRLAFGGMFGQRVAFPPGLERVSFPLHPLFDLRRATIGACTPPGAVEVAVSNRVSNEKILTFHY